MQKLSARKNILVTTPWSFKDGLIQAYTLPYLRIIKNYIGEGKIFLVTDEKVNMRLNANELSTTISSLKSEGIEWLPQDYSPFSMRAIGRKVKQLFILRRLIAEHKISNIHSWTTPGGVLGYCLSKLTGKPLVLDSFEPHAEAQVENKTWTKSSLGFKLLWWFEKKMAKHASALIYTSGNMIAYAKSKYGVYDDREFIKPACVDAEAFTTASRKDPRLLDTLNLKGKIVAVYAGKLGGIYHDIELFEFVKAANDFWKGEFRLLMLTSEPRERIELFASKANVNSEIIVSTFVSHANIPSYLKLADFALTFVKSVPTKRCCTPIKDGEYWASGLPIIITKEIGDDSKIIDETGFGFVLDGTTTKDYIMANEKMQELINNSTGESNSSIVDLALKHRSFDAARAIYSTLYA